MKKWLAEMLLPAIKEHLVPIVKDLARQEAEYLLQEYIKKQGGLK